MKHNNLIKMSLISVILSFLLVNFSMAAELTATGEELIAAAVKNSKDLFNAGKNPVFYQVVNPDNKPVSSIQTVVVFYDYNCTYSRELMHLLRVQLEKKLYKIIYRPIGMMSDTSKTIAELALAAYQTKPESFLDFHNELSEIKYTLPLSIDNLRTIVSKVGLKYDDLVNIVNKEALGNVIMANRVIYDKIKFPGVPSIILAKLDSNNNIINDKIYYVAGSDKNQLEYKLYQISL